METHSEWSAVGGVVSIDSCDHQAYVLSLLFLRYNETCGLILALTLSAYQECAFSFSL